jgi:hypothetical protein
MEETVLRMRLPGYSEPVNDSSLQLPLGPLLPVSCQLLNASTSLYETRYVYHDTWAHLNGVYHKSLSSVYVSIYVFLLSLLGNSTVNTLPRQRTNATTEELLCASFFYAVLVVWKESLWICVSPLSLLGNNSVNTFPLQRTVICIVFYAVLVVSKQSRRLVLSVTSRFQW